MISAGKTLEIKVGRQILCKEKPNTRATSACAKQLTKTVKAAKHGLTAKQQKLWQKYVYVPALLQVKLFCAENSKDPGVCDPYDAGCKLPSKAVLFKRCVNNALQGKIKFKDIFGKKFKWSDFLIKGAKMIENVRTSRPKVINPFADD